MKRLFSPSFIVWLTESTPEDFAFEFSAGSLCVNVKATTTAPPSSTGSAPRPARSPGASSAKRRSRPAPPKVHAQNQGSSDPELAMIAAATISSTDGTRSRATTSCIFGAARAARSATSRR